MGCGPSQLDLDTKLLDAAKSGNLAATREALGGGAKLECKDSDKYTPLHWAVRKGHLECARLLLERGAEMHNGAVGGETPLHVAVSYGQLECARLLLDRGTAKDIGDYSAGSSPLHFAAKGNSPGCVQLLLERGAVVDSRNSGKYTPLHWAASGGNVECARLLLERGAEKDAKNKDGKTALDLAKGDAMRALLRSPPAQQSGNNSGATPLRAARAAAPVPAELATRQGAAMGRGPSQLDLDTKLLDAAKSGDVAAARKALDGGAKLESKDEDARTPLILATNRGHLEVVRLLLDRGADKEAKEKDGRRTPLLSASIAGHLEVARLLLERGADMEAKNNDAGGTPLYYAAAFGKLEVVRLLVERGADKEAKNTLADDRPTLTAAAFNGHPEVVRLLLERGADKEAKDKSGATPMHFSASQGHLEVVRLLLERGANKEAKDIGGRTPLNSAADQGHLEVVRLLLERGADKDAKSASALSRGFTPLMVAAIRGHLEVVRLLLERGAIKEVKDKDGKTALDLAKDDAMRALLRNPQTQQRGNNSSAAPEKATCAAVSVPSELATWLASLGLSEHGAKLVADHKLHFVQDVRVLDRDDLLKSGLAKVEAERFLKAAAQIDDSKLASAPAEGGVGPRASVRALVIGINAYAPVKLDSRGVIAPGSGPGALDNAVADAKAVHGALNALPGGASTLLLNCTKAQLEQALKDFRDSTGLCKERGMKVAAAAKDASAPAPRTLGVVFFAGHGLQLNKSNYVVPVDWVVPSANEDPKVMESDAADGCVSLESVEKMLSQTTMSAGSILLDCCRDTPDFVAMAPSKLRSAGGTRSLPLGMGHVDLRLRDVMVTFATAPGTCALDRSSRLPSHSPFTAALLKALAVPGLTLLRLNPLLTQEVEADTGGKQRPHVGGSYGVEAADLVLLG